MTQFEYQRATSESDNVSRRGLLGSAAFGASGLALMQAAVGADATHIAGSLPSGPLLSFSH